MQIGQVILNLLNNAHDALEHLPEKWIHLSVREEGDYYFLRITDSGNGIPLDLRQKIMMPFFTTKEIGKGTGLGLSVSKSIVILHHGQLYIDTQSPYTCFVMGLPKTGSRVLNPDRLE